MQESTPRGNLRVGPEGWHTLKIMINTLSQLHVGKPKNSNHPQMLIFFIEFLQFFGVPAAFHKLATLAPPVRADEASNACGTTWNTTESVSSGCLSVSSNDL